MMTNRVQFFGSWLCCFAMAGCGPVVAPGSTGSTTGAEPSEDTRSVDPPVTTATTHAVTTVSTTLPGDTTDGSVDTGWVWPDFPEYCSILEQDCPPGYKCMPYSNDGGSWNDVMCVPIADDPGTPGDPCTVEGGAASGIDDCDQTSMCWDVDPDTNEGVCVAHCIGDLDRPVCADRCDRCSISADGPLLLCLPTCDPVLQNCAEGQGCYPIQDYFTCAPDASTPELGIGSPCEFINICPAGLVCANASDVPGCKGGIGCCTPVCAVGGFDPCPGLLPGSVCVPWYGDQPPPKEGCLVSEPGVCVAP